MPFDALRALRMRLYDSVGLGEPQLVALPAHWCDEAQTLRERVEPTALREEVEALPAPRSRLHAPVEMAAAEARIRSRFEDSGWSVEFQFVPGDGEGGRLDHGSFGAKRHVNVHGRNILGLKCGREGQEAVVLMAHLDTVRGSPGANDNGAALAVLLTAARLLEGVEPARTIVIAITDLEETGMLGSRALLPELRRRFTLTGAINLETIGYMTREPLTQGVPIGFSAVYPSQIARVRSRDYRGDHLAVLYNSGAAELAATFGAALCETSETNAVLLFRALSDIPVISRVIRGTVPVVSTLFRGDHAAFWDAGVPTLLVTDTADLRYPHYHLPTDTPEHLDYEHLRDVAVATAITARIIADA